MNLEEIRMRKVKFVVNSLYACKDAGLSIDYEKLIKEVQIKFNVARRTAMDYIDLAMAHTGSIREDSDILFKDVKYDKILIDEEWKDV